MNKKISDRQQIILSFIEDFISSRKYPPTVREISDSCSIASTSVVSYNLDRLHDLGKIRRIAEISRGIVVL